MLDKHFGLHRRNRGPAKQMNCFSSSQTRVDTTVCCRMLTGVILESIPGKVLFSGASVTF